MNKQFFQLTDLNIIGLIKGLNESLEDGEDIGSLRRYFLPGDKEGQKFIDKLYELKIKGYVRDIVFVCDDNNKPLEAVWSDMKLTSYGENYYQKLKGEIE